MRRWADEALVQVVFVAWRHYSFTGTKADLSSRKSRGIYMRAIPLEILSMLQNYTLKKTTIYFPIEQLKCIRKYRKTTFMSHNMMTCWYHADAFYVNWEANTECYNDVTWRPSWFKSPPIRIFVHISFRISKKTTAKLLTTAHEWKDPTGDCWIHHNKSQHWGNPHFIVWRKF